MEIKGLIKRLRHFGGELGATPLNNVIGKYMLDAATALSTLQAENEKLRDKLERVTAERDAAVDADKAILWLKDYVFEDSRKIYTNGARIIPYFRVLQALRDKAYNGLKEDT